ncbi:MAG: N-acetyl-gamma-glutamyl-phosphate reductase [Myxococcaceae bacterium]|nr:N-acetyl-gamma-glutamyl-phosphate reductase [Myxococcaceae bacterium]
MHKARVGIVGASGYSGMELTRILARHPRVEVAFATSDRWAGERVGARADAIGPSAALRYAAPSEAEALARGCAVVFLATPAEVSLKLAPKLIAMGVRVIDLSGAFRLRQASAYPAWYGFEHGAPALLESAAYGLTEVFRGRVREAQLVANPGCYPTAATLALAPLVKSHLIEPQMVVIHAASGVTGAGRGSGEDYSFCEIDGDFRAYKTLRHQHTPEIDQTLATIAGCQVPVTFLPHLLPIRRGILCTTVAFLTRGASAAAARAALTEAFGDEPFIALLGSADEVALKHVVGTNRCEIGLSSDGARVVVTSAIDNLVKGAAGQAVQNLNVMLGFEETDGL